jgi:CheY-like chemotaxis protein
VRQMGGHVEIETAPRRGTKVKLYFPRSHDDGPKSEPATEWPIAARGETVLVVEDNDGLRDTVCDTLQDFGYKIEQAPNAQDALAILAAGRPVDLLFTDIVLSGSVSGKRLAEAARALRPGLKVLFTTGYSENSAGTREDLEPDAELLTKPYRKEQFAAKLRKVLFADPE